MRRPSKIFTAAALCSFLLPNPAVAPAYNPESPHLFPSQFCGSPGDLNEGRGVFVDGNGKIRGNGTVVTSVDGQELKQPIIVTANHVLSQRESLRQIWEGSSIFFVHTETCTVIPLKVIFGSDKEKDVLIVFPKKKNTSGLIEINLVTDFNPRAHHGSVEVSGHIDDGSGVKAFRQSAVFSPLLNEGISQAMDKEGIPLLEGELVYEMNVIETSSGTGVTVMDENGNSELGAIARQRVEIAWQEGEIDHYAIVTSNFVLVVEYANWSSYPMGSNFWWAKNVVGLVAIKLGLN